MSSSSHLRPKSNTSRILPTSNRQALDPESHRFVTLNSTNVSTSSATIHQRRTSIVNHHQRRNSQLRKASFTTSILVCDIGP